MRCATSPPPPRQFSEQGACCTHSAAALSSTASPCCALLAPAQPHVCSTKLQCAPRSSPPKPPLSPCKQLRTGAEHITCINYCVLLMLRAAHRRARSSMGVRQQSGKVWHTTMSGRSRSAGGSRCTSTWEQRMDRMHVTLITALCTQRHPDLQGPTHDLCTIHEDARMHHTPMPGTLQ